MSDKERLVCLSLLGQEYSFYTGAPDEELERVFSLVRKLVEESSAKAKSGTLPVSKTAIMACLNIASRYIRLQQDFESYRKENEAKMASLCSKIDQALVAEK